MDNKHKFLVMGLLMGSCPAMAHADIVINEIMQSNVYCIMDDINEFPDSWIEIYNSGDTGVNLEGYKIGLKDKASKAYTIPTFTNLAPGGYVLIYCDKVGEGLHADFRVDSGKGDVYLFDPDGNIIDNISLKKMPAPDVSYGRKKDGDSKWGYQLEATPGKANTSGTTDVVLGEVTFSEPGGVWAQERTFTLELGLPEGSPEGTYIIYTTNGDEPTVAKATKYTEPITINNSTVVRAKAVCEGAISRPSNAQSYLVLGREPKIPVISIVVNKDYLYDYHIGIFADGPGGYNNENYRYDWRRPINLEFFEPGEGTESSLNQLCETRVQGGYTRMNPLKSMAVYANKRFGTKRFEYEFWAKDKPGITDNKSFILRNGGNDYTWCYIRDALIQRIIGRNTIIDWQGYSPAIVMINGKYHAMLAIRERSNEDNVAANYGGLEDLDMIENWEELKEGDWEAFDYLMEFMKEEHTMAEWAEVVNLESYTNLMSINYWVYNTDFPHNNIIMWRRTDGIDGRWQWLVKDCDFGLGIWNTEENLYKDFHAYLYSNSTPSAGFDFYQQLMRCEEFREYYINHLVAYMGDFMNSNTFLEYLDEIIEENQGEQQISHDVWAATGWWVPNLNDNLRFMRNWITKRQGTMANIMKKSWGLGNAVNVTVNKDLTDDQLADMKITYADVPLTRNVFDGKDYVGRTISLKASDDDNVIGWTVKIGDGEAQDYDGKTFTYVIDSTKKVTINAKLSDAGIQDVAADKNHAIRQNGQAVYGEGTLTAYDMAGRAVAKGINEITLPAKGIYLIKGENGASAKVVY